MVNRVNIFVKATMHAKNYGDGTHFGIFVAVGIVRFHPYLSDLFRFDWGNPMNHTIDMELMILAQ